MLWQLDRETGRFAPTGVSDPIIDRVLAGARAACGMEPRETPFDCNSIFDVKKKKPKWIPPPGWRPKRKKRCIELNSQRTMF